MTKIHSYTICHYGKDYLAWALRSIFPFVEQAHVFYTPHASHGHQSQARPIENEDELKEAAYQFDYNDKVVWHNQSGIRYEGPQRDNAVQIVKESGADIIIVLDCDEVWNVNVLEQALEIVKKGDARNWLVNFTHLWRSFNWCCRDQGWPVRFIDLRQEDGNGYIPKELGEIFHFGYAVRDEVMKYKWKIHGHRNELCSGWLEDQWQADCPVKDCHPTNENNFWNTEKFDKDMLPHFMKEHPFYHLDRIE